MRECGACQVCCHRVEVVELGKPASQDCAHQCAEGCAVYADRPSACAQYRCSWLEGHGGDEDRPDKSGVLLETITDGIGGTYLFMLDGSLVETDRELLERFVRKKVTVVQTIPGGAHIAAFDSDDRQMTEQIVYGISSGQVEIQMNDQVLKAPSQPKRPNNPLAKAKAKHGKSKR